MKPKPQALERVWCLCYLLSLVYVEEVAGGRTREAAWEGRWGRGYKTARFLQQFCASATKSSLQSTLGPYWVSSQAADVSLLQGPVYYSSFKQNTSFTINLKVTSPTHVAHDFSTQWRLLFPLYSYFYKWLLYARLLPNMYFCRKRIPFVPKTCWVTKPRTISWPLPYFFNVYEQYR